jgi:hypothetical protein
MKFGIKIFIRYLQMLNENFLCFKSTNLMMEQIFEAISDSFKIEEVCTSGNYTQI